jgi:hypothetical protein
MGYDAALKKAWDAVKNIDIEQGYLKFLNNEYEIDYTEKNIISMSSNVPAKDYYKLLILHYIANENKVLKISNDKWMSFKELDGGEIYFPAFKKRVIDLILKKYSDIPSAIFKCIKSLNAEKIDAGSAGISINVFPKVKVAIIIWAKDDEFAADCNMLFNPEIKDILPTEDIAVLGGILAYLI